MIPRIDGSIGTKDLPNRIRSRDDGRFQLRFPEARVNHPEVKRSRRMSARKRFNAGV